jgi:hypothetical protein
VSLKIIPLHIEVVGLLQQNDWGNDYLRGKDTSPGTPTVPLPSCVNHTQEGNLKRFLFMHEEGRGPLKIKHVHIISID